ncbi:MAG: SH3 domain-containing protein [Aquamicrobium sp.]|uniref:SH3 domain-containing protein n=1 Tax=Aquamicrobium sp. TaxID=1872579 RepID=UPI00349E50C7|nr:SH3 domain-containing protein [Aquamicrobium sp.]
MSSRTAIAAVFGVALAMLAPTASPSLAQSAAVGPSGLPLPRFVSLKSSKVNLRIGPGLNYPVEWLYMKAGVPMEIIQEYDNWRRVRDAEGAEGWINQSLLSGRRTAIAAPWQRHKDSELLLRDGPDTTSRIVARLEPGAVGTIRSCNGQWCEMEFSGHKGWLSQTQIWGAYPGETYKD